MTSRMKTGMAPLTTWPSTCAFTMLLRVWGTYVLDVVCMFFRALSMVGLVLIAMGTGGIKPCVAAFGGDQFEDHQVRLRPYQIVCLWNVCHCECLLTVAQTVCLCWCWSRPVCHACVHVAHIRPNSSDACSYRWRLLSSICICVLFHPVIFELITTGPCSGSRPGVKVHALPRLWSAVACKWHWRLSCLSLLLLYSGKAEKRLLLYILHLHQCRQPAVHHHHPYPERSAEAKHTAETWNITCWLCLCVCVCVC